MIYDRDTLSSLWGKKEPDVIKYSASNSSEPFKPYSIDMFACKCKCGKLPENDYFVNFMNYLYERSGKIYEISSCVRCLDHNQRVGGLPTSDHLRSLAIDILTPTIEDRSNIVFYAFNYGIKRAIIYIKRKFVHLSINYDAKLTHPLIITHEELV